MRKQHPTKSFTSYLKGEIRPSAEAQSARYLAWRRNVPWTDAQIVDALRRYADGHTSVWFQTRARQWADRLEATGRLYPWVFSEALGFLITTCGVCGKKALYRKGNEGRCSTHRDVPEKWSTARHARSESRARLEAADRKFKDDLTVRVQALKGSGRFRNNHTKA